MTEPGTVAIDTVDVLDDALLTAMERLLPQLSSSATFDERTIAWVVSHEACTLLTATVDSVVVGALTLVTYPLPTGLRAHIDDVVVEDVVRGRGVGEALVRAALDRAVAGVGDPALRALRLRAARLDALPVDAPVRGVVHVP